ncbi:hypothetical protein [Flavobacterium sp. SM2513]|uniref:hypothetical protein n=1 Tax=Flavobacterium sp. SM2513 TaxID=3424766 RepID=UPI003D7F89C3
MNRFLSLLFILSYSLISAQAPFPHITSSTFNAERVASFGVLDVSTDFLEITNSSQFDGSFIPSIWAHQQSDNRFVLRHFATTNTTQDFGTIPLMIFRTEIRNNLNMIAPSGGSFPWGTTASNVATRPLFAWENGNVQLMRILANGFVGIGTTTPTALLHTFGTVRLQNLADSTNPFKLLGTDTNGNVFEFNPAAIGGGTTNDFDWLKTDGGFPGSIDDNIYTNGNVGINVVNPTANLNTNGTLKFENLADSTNPFKILGTDTTGNVFEFNPTELASGGTSDFDWLKTDGGFPGSIDDNIYTNGNVGINVVNPTANLNTNGSLKFENLADSTNPFKILGTDTTGNVFEFNPTELASVGISDFDWLKTDGGFPDSIDDNIYTNGNVGINVVNPTANLNTNGTLKFENLADSTNPFKILGTDTTGNVFEFNPTELASVGISDFDWLKTDGGFPDSIDDNIYTNGNVGINVVNPTANLNTNGTLKFENLADSTNPFKILGTDTTGNVFEFNPTELASVGISDFDWLKTDGGFPDSIDDNIYTNGNVGINVVNPTANLNTNGTLKFENLADSTNPFKILGTDTTGNVFEFNPTELASVGISDFDWLKTDGGFPDSIDDNIYTNGNVGINVVNPTANLNTNGTLKFENLADSTNPFKILGTDTTGNVFEFNPTELASGGTSDFDWLKTDGTSATSINDAIYTNGKVGINTNVFPSEVGDVDVRSYSLYAKGGILTEEVRVALSSEWADFVFDKEYQLDPLEKVEQFIIENKHLKDIPSAEEVKKNGVELGEMNKLLLLKIEELTLYVIEMNKKIELQDKEILKLKAK